MVTLLSVLIGFPVAWMLAIMPQRWANVLFAVILLSMWTNLLARTYAWMVLLQRTGVINKTLMDLGLIDQPLPLVNNLVGVTIGMTYIMLPFVILPLRGVIKAIDPVGAAGGVAMRGDALAMPDEACSSRWQRPASPPAH